MPTMLNKDLIEKFGSLTPQDLKPIYIAVTGSILDLLSEGFIEKKEKRKAHWRIRDFLKVFLFYSILLFIKLNHDYQTCHSIPKNMTPSILRAEQITWLTLVDMMGGSFVKCLSNSVTLITGISDTLNKLEFSLSTNYMNTSFDSIDPVMTDIICKFSDVGEAEIPVDIQHWKNPDFQVCTSRIKFYSTI